MQRPNKQGDLILDLNPLFSNRPEYHNSSLNPSNRCESSQKNPKQDLKDQSDTKDDTLSTAQTTTKRTFYDSPKKLTPSTRENALKIKDILEGYTLTQRPSENKTALSNQYRTLDRQCDVSIDYSNDLNSSNESSGPSKSFQRPSSTNTSIHRKSKGLNSSFAAAYQPDLLNKSMTSQRNTVQNLKKRSLGNFMPVHRVQRPHSSTGQRQSTVNTRPSLSPEVKVLDESLIEREYGVRMETAPDAGAYSSENTRKVLAERKETLNHFKKQGVQKYENKVLRQELERQMKMLENRVKRLASEDVAIKKNVRKTETVMVKTLTNKQRFHEDLAQSQAVKIKRLEEEQKAREKIKEEKMKRENSIKSKLALIQKEKALNAIQVKSTLQQDLQKTSEELKKEEEKKQKIYQNTAEFEKGSKLRRMTKQQVNKSQMDENHIRFLQEEHMRMLEIEDKIQNLARKEEQLIEQIKSTHRLQVKAEGMMKKVLTTKVGDIRQPEFR